VPPTRFSRRPDLIPVPNTIPISRLAADTTRLSRMIGPQLVRPVPSFLASN
jgi:hypothetical protein